MTNEERLNLRARQLVGDPTLSPNQSIPNQSAMLKALRDSVRTNPDRLASVLAEITDEAVRDMMRAALT